MVGSPVFKRLIGTDLPRHPHALAHEIARRPAARGQTPLEDRDAWLEMAADSAGLGIWEWRRADGGLFMSPKAREIFGFSASGPVTTDMTAAIVHPGDRVKARVQIRRALDPVRRKDRAFGYRIITPAGEHRRIALNVRAVFETVGGAQRASRFLGAFRDVTARTAALARREESESLMRLAVEAGRLAVWQSDLATGEVRGPDLNAILGYPPDHPLTADDVRACYLPGELERIRAITTVAYARGERQVELEYRFRRRDGEARWLLMRGDLKLNAEGQPRASVGVAMDITDRKEAQEREKLLAREVDHRANNLLAVIQSLVQLSKAETPETLRQVLIGRITALGRAHKLLSEARWSGAALRRLVVEELLAYSLGEASRVSICGEDVALSPAAAQALAMVLHELATNATKYGALSAPGGRVDVSWSRQEAGDLTIRWTETGGPPVTPPTRRGLGAVMLSRALAGGLGGGTTMDWRPEGLVCELRLPGEALEGAAC